MVNIENDIDSMTNFKRQTAQFLERLRQSGEPVVLTVKGKVEVLVQDAAAYKRLVEAAARSAARKPSPLSDPVWRMRRQASQNLLARR